MRLVRPLPTRRPTSPRPRPSPVSEQIRKRVTALCQDLPIETIAAASRMSQASVRRQLVGQDLVSARLVIGVCQLTRASADWLLLGR